MEWNAITLPADSTMIHRDGTRSWQASGKSGDYILAALTNRDLADTAAEADTVSDPDAVIGYLISRGLFSPPERVVRVSETGRSKWTRPGECRVPAADLLVTAKAFCEYYEVHGAFPERKTWKTQAALYRDIAEGRAISPVPEAPQNTMPDLNEAPAMFSVFDEPTDKPVSAPTPPAVPDYFPATPFTLVTDARADEESGHEFVLHFDPEQERYCVFFFADERYANLVRDEFNEYSKDKWATVVRFDPRAIEERFGVRYTDGSGKQTDMSIQEYRANMEMKNEFRRDDD